MSLKKKGVTASASNEEKKLLIKTWANLFAKYKMFNK
jgi:hypothetical protein